MMDDLLRQIEADLYRVRLASPTGLVVNAWLLQERGHAVLIDAGFPWTVPALEEALAARGLRLEELDAVVYTHTHQDHMGGGALVASRVGGAHVMNDRAHAFFRTWFSSFARFPQAVEAYATHLPDDDRSREVLNQLEGERDPVVHGRDPGDAARVQPVRVGEVLDIGPWRLRCVDVAGHDPSHVAWYDEARGRLFVGDAVMSVPTPFALHLLDEPALWLASLERIEALEISRMLPGHGMPTTLIAPSIARSRAFFERHVDALGRVAAQGRFHPLDVVDEMLRNERARYAARLGVTLATTITLLDLGERAGRLHRDASRHLEMRAPLLDVDGIRALAAAS